MQVVSRVVVVTQTADRPRGSATRRRSAGGMGALGWVVSRISTIEVSVFEFVLVEAKRVMHRSYVKLLYHQLSILRWRFRLT